MPDDREPAEAVGQERPGRLAQGTAHSQLHAAAMDLQDLTMGDILMLSTAMPPPAGPARQRDAMDIGPRSYTMEDDYRRYSPPASTSNPRGALSSSLISNALPPQKTVATHEQVASSVDGIPGPSSSSTSFSTPATSADRYPKTTHTSSTSNKLHSLLTSSRNTLPPPPTLNADPSFLPPPPLLPRIAAPTSSTATPHHTSTTTSSSVLPNTASHAASAHSPGPSSASFGTAPLLPSSLPSPLPQQQQLPINSNDGRYKRYTETQADYKPGGYARIKEGDRLNRGRYEVVKKLGVGHFSVVWLAWDRE